MLMYAYTHVVTPSTVVQHIVDVLMYDSTAGTSVQPGLRMGLAFVAPTGTHTHIYMSGVVADTSSQPALPISKRNLGRLDTLVSKNV